jgi:hydrogenase expression/formation protein HypC
MCLAVPLKLIEVSADGKSGTAALGGSTMTVGLDLVPSAMPGDYVLVHAGMAIEVQEEAEARETLDIYLQFAHVPGLLEPDTDANG